MAPKILTLTQDLESKNFVNKGKKKDHRNFQHPKGINITICGNLNQEAKPYQIKDVKRAIEIISDE